HAGQDLREIARRQRARGDAELPLALDVAAQRVRVAVADELQEAHALEAAVAAHGLAEVAKDLQALERQPRLVLVGVVHAHESARLAGSARGQMAALEQ